MNDDAIQDLKQFITTTISQQTAAITAHLDKVERKVDDLSQSVAQAIDTSNEADNAQLKDHEQRITLLEQKAA